MIRVTQFMVGFLEGFRTILFAALAVIKDIFNSIGVTIGDQIAAAILVSLIVFLVGLIFVAKGSSSGRSGGGKPGSAEFQLSLLRELKADADAYQELYDNGLIDADFFSREMEQIAQVASPMVISLQSSK